MCHVVLMYPPTNKLIFGDMSYATGNDIMLTPLESYLCPCTCLFTGMDQ